MTDKKKNSSKAKLAVIIIAAVALAISIALIITNIFIPVKYLSSYFVKRRRAEEGIMRVSFVDVGYGDCIIVELPDGKNMLIDGGNGAYSNNVRMLKELNRRNINTIDYLICSSINEEHCGGLKQILKYKKVKNAYIPYCLSKYCTQEFFEFSQTAKEVCENVFYNEYDLRVSGENWFFTFLSPSVVSNDEGEYAQFNSNPTVSGGNNCSAITWLEYGDIALLFTSDVESDILSSIALTYLVDPFDYPVDFEKCKIVELAAHGSENSTSIDFYSAVGPEACIVTAAEGDVNPSIAAMSDIEDIVGNYVYSTSYCGTIVIDVTATDYKINRGKK